jgi:hypothetical protein
LSVFNQAKKSRKDIPLDRLDLEINVEVEGELDTEGFTALVEGTDDSLETGLDFNLGGSVGGLLDGVLFVSGVMGKQEERCWRLINVRLRKGRRKWRKEGRSEKSTHDRSLQLGDDAENLRVVGRALGSVSSSLELVGNDGVADRGSKDRGDKGKSE